MGKSHGDTRRSFGGEFGAKPNQVLGVELAPRAGLEPATN